MWDTTAAAATISTVSTLGGLRIHPEARLKLLPGAQITASGNTEINEPKGLWIVSDATGTGSFIDNGTITYDAAATHSAGASALVQRFFVPDQWHGYCIPVMTKDGGTQAGTTPFIDYYMMYYNNAIDADGSQHAFRYVIDPARQDSAFTIKGLGYMMYSSSATTNTTPVTLTGTMNTGAISTSIPRSPYPGAPGADYDNWYMVGNTYPSAVDLSNAGIIWTNVIQEAYFWNPSTGNYEVYIKAGGGDHGGVGQNSPYAPAQQGFFVRHDTVETTAGTFGYPASGVRVHNAAAFLKESLPDLLGITVTNSVNGYSDQGTIRFAEETTPGLDENIDAVKLAGDAAAPSMYFPVPGENNLHITVMPWIANTMTIPMSYAFASAGNNQIQIENVESFKQGTQIFLEDKLMSNMQDMVANPKYKFASNPQDDPARFVWHFTKSTIGIDEPMTGFQIYSFEDYVYVKNLVKGATYGHVWIYDITGRKVFDADLKDMTINKFEPGVVSGYYVVRVVNHEGSYTQKLYVQ